MKTHYIPAVIIAAIFSLFISHAHAARSFTSVQTSPVPGGTQFNMGTTQSITFRITNTNTNPHTGESIRILRFRISASCSAPCTATAFSAATTAPAGWAKTTSTATTVTFTAAAAANYITTGNFQDFTVILNMGTLTRDTNQTLRDIRATYTGGNRVTNNNPGSWALKSLSITSFQTIDTCATGNPISSLNAGSNFSMRMTVQNISSATQNSITSNPASPTAIKTGTVTQSLVSTSYSPNPLTLATGATGTICFTYSTNVNDSGTIYFTASARNNTNNATSLIATSNTLSVGRFTAAIAASRSCAYNGQNFTVTMTLTNGYSNNIINVTPALTPSQAWVTMISGPTPSAPNGPVPPGGGAFAFTWVYQINGGSIGSTVNFTGSAAGTEQGPGTPRTTPVATSGNVTKGGYAVALNPGSTYASSAEEELAWSFQNQGCANINSVSIAAPAGGWTYGSGYSLIGNANYETWNLSGANPYTFTAPLAAQQLLTGQSGDYRLVFSATPSAAGLYSFIISITDANADTDSYTTSVTVNAFDNSTQGIGNYTIPGIWRENY